MRQRKKRAAAIVLVALVIGLIVAMALSHEGGVEGTRILLGSRWRWGSDTQEITCLDGRQHVWGDTTFRGPLQVERLRLSDKSLKWLGSVCVGCISDSEWPKRRTAPDGSTVLHFYVPPRR